MTILNEDQETDNSFEVDLSSIHKNRKVGVSGMMRVRNDAEFIEACVESCINALDELVIVYNDCSDDSPEIIKAMAERYPEKIKVYEYTPWLYCGNLTFEEYEKAKSLPHTSIHLLSNYYNYALSKTTYQFVLKIDADQIYFTERLSEICARYRTRRLNIPNILETIAFIKINILYRTNSKIRTTTRTFINYQKCINKLISFCGITTSYSGINIVADDKDNKLIPLGRETSDLNILPPFNGVGDHLIFKVKSNTRFIPYDCEEYKTMISGDYTYIEKLVGNSRFFLNGFLWWHLNGMRKNIIGKQRENIQNYPESFLLFDKAVCFSPEELLSLCKSTLCTLQYKRNMNLNWNIFNTKKAFTIE